MLAFHNNLHSGWLNKKNGLFSLDVIGGRLPQNKTINAAFRGI